MRRRGVETEEAVAIRTAALTLAMAVTMTVIVTRAVGRTRAAPPATMATVSTPSREKTVPTTIKGPADSPLPWTTSLPPVSTTVG